MNIYGACVLATSSGILALYSNFANQRGWPQGTFFLSQKAALLGMVGMVVAAILAYMAIGGWGIALAVLAAWLIPAPLLLFLGSNGQLISLIGFFLGLIVAFF